MFKQFLLISSISFVIAGCGPAPAQLTSTALAMEALTETAVPTVTPVPTFTPTPTLTPTIMPSPTPVGGGNGTLVFFVNPWWYDRDPAVSEEDGVYTVNSDGSGLQQILSRSQIEAMLGGGYQRGLYFSDVGQGYIFILGDGVYSVTDDWQLIRKMDAPNSGLFSLSQYISYVTKLLHDSGAQPNKLLGANDYYLGWSADGSTVYFEKDQRSRMLAINSDGSNKRELELKALENYTPYEGVSLPDGILGLGTAIRRLDTHAVSPDGTKVAFTWEDLLFLTDATDVEFSHPELVLRLVSSDPEVLTSAKELIWSPDNRRVLLKLRKFHFTIPQTWGDIILVDLESGEPETIISSTEFDHGLCNFSPDGRVVVSRYDNFPEKKSVLVFTSLDDKSQITISQNRSVECPTWQ